MQKNVPYTKTSLCANVQLNSTNLDFQLVIITYALFPSGPCIYIFVKIIRVRLVNVPEKKNKQNCFKNTLLLSCTSIDVTTYWPYKINF